MSSLAMIRLRWYYVSIRPEECMVFLNALLTGAFIVLCHRSVTYTTYTLYTLALYAKMCRLECLFHQGSVVQAVKD